MRNSYEADLVCDQCGSRVQVHTEDVEEINSYTETFNAQHAEHAKPAAWPGATPPKDM